MSDETEGKTKRPNQVESGLVELDSLPPAPERKSGGGGGVSEFAVLLSELQAETAKHRKPISMRRYGSETGAKAARNVLRQRLGRDATVSGHEFYVRNIDGKHHLIAVYDPSLIVAGAADKHVKDEKERLGKLEQKRKAKALQDAKDKVEAAIPADSSIPPRPQNVTAPANA